MTGSLSLTGVESLSRSAPTPTTSRSPPAGCCWRWRPQPRTAGALRAAHRQRRSGMPRLRPPRRRSCPGPSSPSPCTTCPTADCPRTGARSRSTCTRRSRRSRPTSCSALGRRRPPGPPAARRAGADRVPVRARTAVRDPEMGRRPRPAQPVRCRCPTERARRKVELLHEHFPSQKGRDWWDDEVFLGLARLRGMECRSGTPRRSTPTSSASTCRLPSPPAAVQTWSTSGMKDGTAAPVATLRRTSACRPTQTSCGNN